jgi:hypothetical protein
MAVGRSNGASVAYEWNGLSWLTAGVVGTSPLRGVSCPTTTWCMTVPQKAPQHSEIWNGSSWTKVPMPGNTTANFAGVSCVSRIWCMAVGTQEVNLLDVTLVEHWNGTKWKVDTSPDVPGADQALQSVSCVTSSVCMAVGYVDTGPFSFDTLAEDWNGTAWSLVSTPVVAGYSQQNLEGVSCTSKTFCMAGGWDGTNSATFPNVSLTEKWNGTAWSVVASPSPGAHGTEVDGVSCLKSTFCIGVGLGGAGLTPLVLRWGGTSWSVVPSDPAANQWLNVVDCATTTACAGAGQSNNQVSIEMPSSLRPRAHQPAEGPSTSAGQGLRPSGEGGI